jgi:hypothetical protein
MEGAALASWRQFSEAENNSLKTGPFRESIPMRDMDEQRFELLSADAEHDAINRSNRGVPRQASTSVSLGPAADSSKLLSEKCNENTALLHYGEIASPSVTRSIARCSALSRNGVQKAKHWPQG